MGRQLGSSYAAHRTHNGGGLGGGGGGFGGGDGGRGGGDGGGDGGGGGLQEWKQNCYYILTCDDLETYLE